jgi:hypothetical protein
MLKGIVSGPKRFLSDPSDDCGMVLYNASATTVIDMNDSCVKIYVAHSLFFGVSSPGSLPDPRARFARVFV